MFKDSMLTKITYIIKGIMACIIYLIIPKKQRKKNYWLIGGHLGQIYDDNSKAFFEFLIENKKNQEVFWVLNKGSLADKNNKYRENIIYRGTIKGFLYCFRSQCVIVSHSFADVMPIFYRLKARFNIKALFLFHGIYGLKKASSSGREHYSYFDIINAVGDFEKMIKVNYLGINEDKIKIMGLPRYDNLYNKRVCNGNIMIMFTWREYITEKGENDEYFKKIKSLLTNKQLLDYLKKNNVSINVVLHSFVHKYYSFIKELESDNIRILPKDINIQSELINNSLLVTDYSSVAWDFAYMNKPVVFYQFDLEEYLQERGSYLDMKKDLFGDVVYNESKLIDIIKYYVDCNFEINFKKHSKLNNYIKYKDDRNCERVYQEIINNLKCVSEN